MGKTFDLTPVETAKVSTKYRRIATKLPVPESLPILERLRKYEPLSMSGQPPVLWDHAEGVNVYDRWGNKWLDWSSGVLVANAGHSNPKIIDAMVRQIQHRLIHNYCFPSEIRSRLAERLVEIADEGHDKVFLLTTGAEATENAIKLARTYGISKGGERKIKIVSFQRGFHGRTMGAQLAGGSPALKKWIVNIDPTFVQVDFPDGFRCEDVSFKHFLEQIEAQGATHHDIAGVIVESYQGGGASFAPVEYMQELRSWCDANDIVLICDEVQAGFGRTGKLFSYQHYGIVPDLLCAGKGITSGMPLSCVLGKSKIMDLYGPGEMTSTHTGNPVCCAASLANIDVLFGDKLVVNAERMGKVMHAGLARIAGKYEKVVGAHHGKGLVGGLHIVKPGTKEPDGDLAFAICETAFHKGLLMFAPVGFGGATVKVGPPLVISEEAVNEGLAVLEEAFAASVI